MVRKRRFLISFLFLVLLAIGLYGFLPRITGFKDSLHSVAHARVLFVLLAAGASLTATTVAAGVYKSLAYKPLPLGAAAMVQYAGLFVNRVLPAGIGGMGLNFAFLKKRRHTIAQAGTVVALNNFMGFVGHVLLAVVMVGIYLVRPHNTLAWHVHMPATRALLWSVIGLVVFIAVGVVVWRRVGTRIRKNIVTTLRMLSAFYVRHPRRVVTALAISCGLTTMNVLSFWLSCLAVGVHVSIVTAFVVFTLSVVLMTATPTPGGLGGAEAALVAGLVAEHVASGPALASALLYRLVSFWLGLAVGAIALVAIRTRKLI